MIQYDFSEQVVIVTGGTRGIGAAVSAAFNAAGAYVIATYAGNESAAQAFEEAVPGPDRVETVRFDVGSYEETVAFFDDFDAGHDRLDVLVNNAGIRRDSIVGMMPEADWEAVLQTNLGGTYNMSKMAVMRMMGHRYGRIINITSPSGRIGFEGQANYAASKAGQVAFAKSMAREVAKRKITVNCVSPGFIDTDLISELPAEQRKAYKAMVPVRRFGTPDEVANSVLFLASEESAYITGTVLETSGGI